MHEATLGQPLEGIKVLDLSRLLPGPFCTLLLADMGADVLKIEDPSGGDYARYYPPFVDEMGVFFASINRNKRSLTLNLKDARGVEVLERLVLEADVVIESFRPGVMERLGVGHERLRALNPRLIFCAISGYGADGPLSLRAGHDLNFLARSGVLEQTGLPGAKPVVPGFQLADLAGGALYAGLGIVSALFRRERSGQGCFLDISMTDGALSFHLPLQATLAAGEQAGRGQGMLTGGVASYGVYACADGGYLAVGALEPKFWIGFVTAIGAPELAGDGLMTGELGETTRTQVANILKQRDRDAWMEIFASLDLCIEPVLSPAEAFEDELFRARKSFFELCGVRHMRTPLTPHAMEHRRPPLLGEHTHEVLETLGFDAPAIGQLRAEGVV
ncbi:MAG: CoA transferase [Bradymonadaceae bacterium]|nr:CoA transferase [Lujinxingiaceae bacterium]